MSVGEQEARLVLRLGELAAHEPESRRVVRRVEAPATSEARRRLIASVRALRWLARFGSLAGLVVLWVLASHYHWLASTKLPSPIGVWHAFTHLATTGQLENALWSSAQRALKGLAVGAGIGLVLGLAAGLSKTGETLLDAPMQALRMLPTLVMVYFFILWFGAGQVSQISLIAMASFFPLYLNTFSGVRNVDKRLVEAGGSFGLHGFSLLKRVILPGALPSILVGLRQSLGIVWFALIFVEQINTGSGIGALIINAENISLNVNVMVVGLLLYAGMGLVADLIVRGIEKGALSWRPNFQGR